MKSNLAVRLIIDSENNKVYLSVEGKIENATEEEKSELRDTLTRALSQVIGIETENSLKFVKEAEMVNDFIPASDVMPDFVEQELMGSGLEKNVEAAQDLYEENMRQPQQEKNKFEEELLEEFARKGSVELNFPAKYKGMTPYQVLARYKEDGYKELENIIPILERNRARYPQNAKVIEEIQKALAEYMEYKKLKDEAKKSEEVSLSKFDRMVKKIKTMDKEILEVIKKVCQSRGTTLELVIENRDEEELQAVFEFIETVQKEEKERRYNG